MPNRSVLPAKCSRQLMVFGWAIVFAIGVFGGSVKVSNGQTADSLSKAKRYHQLLIKRPSPGYLFDRFYDAWLDQDSAEGLQAHLMAAVNESKDGQATAANRLLLAFFYAKQGQNPASLEQFRQALQDDPGNPTVWYEKAVVEARTLNYESAIADLTKADEQKPDKKLATKIARLKGKLLVRNRETEKAIAVWQQLLKQNPNDDDLHEGLVELQLGEGLYQEAAKLSQALVEKTRDPYKKVVRCVRTGEIYVLAEQREKALSVFGDSLRRVGADSWIAKEILTQIEHLFRREDDLVGLQSHYQTLLKQHPGRILIRKRYATLLVDLGRQEEALRQFDELLALTPGDRTNREEYVALLVRLDRQPAATEQLQALIKQHPRDPELQVKLANLLFQQDKSRAAALAIEQYMAISDRSEYAYLRAARLLSRFGLHEEATNVYERLAQAYPDSIASQEAFAAFLYDERKQTKRALAMWRSLAEGQERSQLVRIARILTTRQEHEAAFDLLKQRLSDFAHDPVFLGQLVKECIALKRYEAAIPWASQRVIAAETVADLEAAIEQAARLISKADRLAVEIENLRNNAHRTTQQTCLLAELLERASESRQADAILAAGEDGQAPQADPSAKLFVVSQQIRLWTQRNDWAEAASATQRLLTLPGGRKSIYVRRLVELYQRDDKHDEALQWVQQWKKLSPGSTLPWYTEARILTYQGKSSESLDCLRSAVQRFEGDSDLRARLAQAYIDSQKVADAERIYWRLYDDAKDVSEKMRWVQELARAAQAESKVDRLLERFEERRANNRQSIVPLMAISEIHRTTNNSEGRRKALQEATRLKPNDLELLFQVARIEEAENDWESTFEDRSLLSGTSYGPRGTAEAGMGIAPGDFDGDGRLDLVVTNYEGETQALYSQRGPLLFTDLRFAAGLAEPTLRQLAFGAGTADLDHDGDLDLAFANGHVRENAEAFSASSRYRQPNQIFENVGRGRFKLADAGLDHAAASRGLAFGDLDGDGDLDLVITNVDEGPEVYENLHPGAGKDALRITFRRTEGERFSTGTKVFLAGETLRARREVLAGSSYLSQDALTVHFGTADEATVDVTVQTPDGSKRTLRKVPTGQRLVWMD